MPRTRTRSKSRSRSRSRSRSHSKTGGKGAHNDFYCMKCKKSVSVSPDTIKHLKTKKGTDRRAGKCPACGTNVSKMGK